MKGHADSRTKKLYDRPWSVATPIPIIPVASEADAVLEQQRETESSLTVDRTTTRLAGIYTIPEASALGEQATEVIHIALMALLTESGADLFNSACFNYPTLGDLYKYATYDAILQHAGKVSPMQQATIRGE